MARFNETRSSISSSTPPVLTGLFWFVIIVVVLTLLGTGVYWFTEPARVGIQNRAFHNSQAYQDGMARDLENFRMAYLTADDQAKLVIKATVRHRFAGYDTSTLPPDLQMFLQEMRS